LITLDDARPTSASPVLTSRGAAAPRASRLADIFLHAVLYLCVLSSFFVFVQPAPYEFLIAVLVFACILARVHIDAKVLPLLFLMMIRDVSGIYPFLYVMDRPRSVQFMLIHFYMGLNVMVFACLFAQDSMRRLATLRAAYVLAGVVGTVLGLIGYFKLLPGFHELFVLNDRVVSGFKDPNVFGPFLIPPLLWLIQGFVTDRFRLISVVCSMILTTGLILAYSRAAWIHFVISIAVMIWLLYFTSPDRTSRKRIVILVVAGLIGFVALFAVLMSIETVREMLIQRASLQSYDTGSEGSRINTQAKAFYNMFEYPLGMGPWEFLRINRLAAHNSILGTMLNLGWIAGFAYTAVILLTLAIGLRCLMVRTPWQPFLIATYASYVGVLPVGFVIDTDHWRHYYLVVGIIWGLSIATINLRRTAHPPSPGPMPAAYQPSS
jgi:hypothetical protein